MRLAPAPSRPFVAALLSAVAMTAALGVAAPAFADPAQDRFFVTSDGVRLHYLEAGPADAQTMVFVPGWRMPAWIWQQQIEAFSRTRHVIAFDPRGQGDSDIPPSGYDPSRRGKDIGELIDQLGPRPVLVVAWSLGVLDTLAYVADRGDRQVAGLVLVDNSVGEEPAPVAGPSYGHAIKRPPQEAMHDFVRGMFHTPQDEAYLDRLTTASLRTPEHAAALLKNYPAPRTFWRDAIYSTGKPVLYVVRPRWEAQGENLVRKHRSAEMKVFSSAGHAIFVDEAKTFDADVDDFISRKVWP
jgi:non-heme chloroperoxidase